MRKRERKKERKRGDEKELEKKRRGRILKNVLKPYRPKERDRRVSMKERKERVKDDEK